VYSEDKGLQQKFIFSIDQDTNGVLVLGTESGVIAYNGEYFAPAAPVSSLAEQQVASVLSTERGSLWAGHFQSGITCISRNMAGVVDSSEHVRGRIHAMDEDEQGIVWGIADGHGLFRIDPVSRKAHSVPGGESGTGRVVCYGKQLLVASEAGVRVYEVGADLSVQLLFVLPETQNKNVTGICVGKVFQQNVVFAAVEGDGVYYYTSAAKSFECKGKIANELLPADVLISAMTCDQYNSLWIGSMGYGLYKFGFGPTLLPVSSEVFNEASGLIDNNVQSLLVDDENNLWVGTFGSGLVEIPYSVFRFYTTNNGLARPEVNCIVRGDNDVMWVGTDAGLTKFRPGEKAEHYDHRNGFIDEKVTCLAADTAGFIWIGTSGDGIYTLDPSSMTFRNVSSRFHLRSANITALVALQNGEVYAGTTDGLYVFRNHTAPPDYYTTLNGLAHNNIRQLHADQAGNVWFASEGSPPYVMRNGKVTVVNDITNLQSYVINSVSEDNAGEHWVSTDGDGVFSFTLGAGGGSQVRENYSMKEGLRSDHCIAASADESGLLWVVHKSGVSMKFSGDSFFYSFTANDNKLFDNMNPCVYQDRNGSVFFCSADGLIEVTPASKEYLRRDPHISLANLFIDGSERFPTQSIELGPGSYNLTFEFNKILFGSNVSEPFYYRILGADTIWRSASGRSIVIPQLSSGIYVLQVLSSRRAVLNGNDPLSVRISIDYPFWQKTWFIVAMILFVPLVIYGIIRMRTLSLVRMNERLHVLVREKTFLLENEKESVARINVELRQKSKDITDSIRYAKRIQMAILPDLEIFRRNFPDSFIFYQPRDIVSGDFYWFAERDDLFFIAIADCTGHGVPGAFMSMISSTLINKVVFDHGYTRPSAILQTLNNEIKSSLHQQESSDSSHDGLDIALCVIDRKNNVLRFAGAGRPLLLVRNGAISIHKSNKGGLGGVYSRTSPVFEEFVIDMQPGDCFYMYSDGYTDQFGGARQNKFSSPNLRGLLQMIAPLPMEEQGKNVREAFNTWKGNEEQCDDVLVAGFKV
jgi:ligand-binding sensor domain-containing protein/serine phosphatase RsbU (regulator of sigma subunit)